MTENSYFQPESFLMSREFKTNSEMSTYKDIEQEKFTPISEFREKLENTSAAATPLYRDSFDERETAPYFHTIQNKGNNYMECRHTLPSSPSSFCPSISPQLTESGGYSATLQLSSTTSPPRRVLNGGTHSMGTLGSDTVSLGTPSGPRHGSRKSSGGSGGGGAEGWLTLQEFDSPKQGEEIQQISEEGRCNKVSSNNPVFFVTLDGQQCDWDKSKKCPDTIPASVIRTSYCGECGKNQEEKQEKADSLPLKNGLTGFPLNQVSSDENLPAGSYTKSRCYSFMEIIPEWEEEARRQRRRWTHTESFISARREAHDTAMSFILQKYGKYLT